MSRLIYPSSGMSEYCKSYTKSCYDSLSQAISKCNFDIPSGFSYRNYLMGLDDNIRNYRNEIENIDFKISKVDGNFNTLSSDLESNAKAMEFTKIKDRDRMIV